ncbi:serine hydrolase domain-containing protein [Sphaerisporangium sp. B11E5]|uniref:serine hydrolase domain-containing protein n=1 Tax=Sphaerisporangium sp. B11E5 TaxID=3153563 RepID=UPI00325C7EFE
MAAQGHCAPRFRRVREVFEQNFAAGEELGAAFAVYLDGEPVVDLWDGVADRHTGREWQKDTPVLTYSCTKAVTATVLLRLAERGAVDVTAPVAGVWPEFAAAGKAQVTVEHLLTHQSGLPVLEHPIPAQDLGDLPAIAAHLAQQPPLWAPGTAHGYHALTYGFLTGEVVRRATGKTVGTLLSEEIATPRDLDMWLDAPEDVIPRAARLSAGDRTPTPRKSEVLPARPAAAAPAPAEDEVPPARRGPAAGTDARRFPGTGTEATAGTGTGVERAVADAVVMSEGPGRAGNPRDVAVLAALDKDSLMSRAMGNPNPNLLKGGANHPVIMRAGWPAMGLVTTARALAGFYRDLVAGELLAPETLRDATRRRVQGPDRVLVLDSSFGLGYMRPSLTFPVPRAAQESAFGHTGLGGSLGLGDVRHRLGMAYTMNRLSQAITGSLRAYRLTEAVYACLEKD